jgi:hypothetical protein
VSTTPPRKTIIVIVDESIPGGPMANERLKKIPVGGSSESAKIDSRKKYRVKIEGKWYEGSFSKQWLGWKFEGYGPTGIQLNLIDEVYEILAPDAKQQRPKGR